MKTVATAVGAVLTAFAGSALANFDATSGAQLQKVWHTWDSIDERVFGDVRRDGRYECWNPRAGHFERVRPGEYQNDLDFHRCRLANGAYYSREAVISREECWNPRAGHFEAVRPGEVQNDLDFSRCRAVGGRYAERRYYRDHREYRDNGRAQECWNPRAGHFESVRPGEIQGDLDFSRCRIVRY